VLGQAILFAMTPQDIAQMPLIALMLHLTVHLCLSLQHNASQIKPPIFATIFPKLIALVLQTQLLACTLLDKPLPARTKKQIVLNTQTKLSAKIRQLANGEMSTHAQIKQLQHLMLTL